MPRARNTRTPRFTKSSEGFSSKAGLSLACTARGICTTAGGWRLRFDPNSGFIQTRFHPNSGPAMAYCRAGTPGCACEWRNIAGVAVLRPMRRLASVLRWRQRKFKTILIRRRASRGHRRRRLVWGCYTLVLARRESRRASKEFPQSGRVAQLAEQLTLNQ
jgi:hypothetical protein